MNRNLPGVLAMLILVSQGWALADNNSDPEQANEYNQSRYFPKKGKYLDWIEANKLSNQGVRQARAGHYKRAVALFQQAIQRYGYDFTYYENMGAALNKCGDLERAESTTEIAAQMSPRRWGPWYNLGLILTREHQYKRALRALQKAKALHAPPSRAAGINRLIAALEHKLESGDTGDSTAADAAPIAPDTAAASADRTVSTPAQPQPPSAESPDNASTQPKESPAPTDPARTIEKGN